MDDEFFASVLKKWACASQEVVDLKKRLGDVEKERNEYRREIVELRARGGGRLSRREQSTTPSFNTTEIMDLDEVGNKLEKARQEYQRRLKELQDARNREDALGREAGNLRLELAQLRSQLKVAGGYQAESDSELSNLKQEKESMTAKIFDLSRRLQQAELAHTEFEARGSDARELEPRQVTDLQQQMSFLEKQIQELQSLTDNLEAENADLREELTATRESLQKFKESNKNLIATIGQLSRIARNVAGVPDLAAAGQQETPKEAATELPILETPQAAEEKQKPSGDLSFNDMTIVEESNDSTRSIPSRRLEVLGSLPVVILDTSINDEDNRFTRGFTSAAVASSIQSLLTRATSSAIGKRRHIEEYLCPRLDHNPWCPSAPGQHGYMLVASNKEKHIYATPKLRNLFVGLPKRNSKEERYFRYLGVYRVAGVDSLCAEEWKSLPSAVRQSYVRTTKGKNKDPRAEEQIAAACASGEDPVLCAKLECIDFDEELYAGLLAIRAKHTAAPKSRVAKRSQEGIYESNIHLQMNKYDAKKLPK